MPPLGLLYLQAAIERTRHRAVFLDAALEGWDHVETARSALATEPDVVGIQAMSFTMPDAYLVARALKRLRPDVATLIGGPHPTLFPGETAGLPDVDFAFAGEGEQGIVEFLDVFHDPTARIRVPGIAARLANELVVTPPRQLLSDLDVLPFPARRSSPWRRYSSVLAERAPNTVMITSRGCPFECVFCNRMGRRYRRHSAAYVLAEIEDILRLGITEIFIHDDTFTLDRERVRAICNGILERSYDIAWEARTRVDLVDAPLLELMRRAGCRRLSFGVESGSPEVLTLMRKGIDLQAAIEVFRACRRLRISTLADFMLGNLGETAREIEQTMAFVRMLDPDYVQFSICSPYPATPLYAMGRARGLIPDDVWRKFACDPLGEFRSPVWTEHFTADELARMTRAAYRNFYFRPRFVLRQLRRIGSFRHCKAMFGAAMGMLRR